jgi:hypothetical protein
LSCGSDSFAELKRRKMKKIIFSLIVCCLASSLYAKNKEAVANEASAHAVVSNKLPALSGVVVDSKTDEILAGVKILHNGREYYTDLNGMFSIDNNSTGKDVLLVSMISYEEKAVQIDDKTRGNLIIKLKQF